MYSYCQCVIKQLVDNYLALRTIPSQIIKVSKKEMPESKCSKNNPFPFKISAENFQTY